MLNTIIQFEVNMICKLLLPQTVYHQMKESQGRRPVLSKDDLHGTTTGATIGSPVVKANNLLFNANLVNDSTYEFTVKQ